MRTAGLSLLLALHVGAGLGHRYPPGAYPPLHPHPHFGGPAHGLPPPPPPPGPGMYQLRDQSHEHPSVLPPPSAGGGAGGGAPNRPSLPHRPPHWPAMLGHQRPMDDMVDITNELGVAVLQDYAYSRGNFAFSPYGVVSVLVVLYEGARGETARQVHTALKLPWDRDVLRVGFRDVHRNLRSYFSHEGYLSGVTLSQSRTALLPEFRRVLRFYGYDVDMPAASEAADNATGTGAPAGGPPLTLGSPEISSLKPAASNGTSTTAGAANPEAATAAPSSTALPTTSAPTNLTTSTTVTSTVTTSTEASVEASTAAVSETPDTAAPPPSRTVPSEGTSTSSATETPPSTTVEASPNTPAVTTSTPTAGTASYAENEVEEEAEGLPPASSGLVGPARLQHQKFPGILMGSRLQEQLNSLFPDGLAEARGDDADLGAADTAQPAPTTTPSPSSQEGLEQGADDADPEPNAAVESETESEPTFTPAPTTAPEWTTETPAEAATETVLPGQEQTTAVEDGRDLAAVTEETTTDVSDPEPEPATETTAFTEDATDTSPTTTAATLEDTTTATSPTEAPAPASAPAQRRARVPGPSLSFWTGLEAASAHNESRTPGRSRRSPGRRRRREVNGGFPDLSLQLQNGMFDSHVATGDELFRQLPRRPFLVDGAFEEPVPVMEYSASFPFAYIPRLHALALEFPLDDERYKLLLLLPVERQGLRQLLQGLSRVPLREVQRALRPTRVQAVVPAFMVEGFVILTPTLQQLGIWDIFDPRRADLSGMTDDPDLYVRNIEQAVTVVVKNYVEILDIQTRTTAARSRLDQFIATHPFLYFVMDSETQVSLMAGKVVDPLNSRIY